MYERIARSGIRSVSYEDLVDLIAQMRMLNAPVIFNLEDWAGEDRLAGGGAGPASVYLMAFPARLTITCHGRDGAVNLDGAETSGSCCGAERGSEIMRGLVEVTR